MLFGSTFAMEKQTTDPGKLHNDNVLKIIPQEQLKLIAAWEESDSSNASLDQENMLHDKIQSTFFGQVDRLLMCKAVTDLQQSHFDFFRCVQKHPTIFDLQWENMTALRRAILGKNVIVTAFLLSMGAPRDQEDIRLIKEGQYIPKFQDETHYHNLFFSDKPEERFNKFRKKAYFSYIESHRMFSKTTPEQNEGCFWIQHLHFDPCLNSNFKPDYIQTHLDQYLDSISKPEDIQTHVEFMDLAIHYPDAKIRYFTSKKRIIESCMTVLRLPLFDLLRFSGAQNPTINFSELYRSAPIVAQALIERNVVSSQQLEEAILDTEKISAEELDFFIRKRLEQPIKFDINAINPWRVPLSVNALSKVVYNISMNKFDERQLTNGMALIKVLFSHGADPFYESSEEWKDCPSYFKPFKYLESIPPFFYFLKEVDSYLCHNKRTQSILDFIDNFISEIKKTPSIKPNPKHLQMWASIGYHWPKSQSLRTFFLENGVDPLECTNRGHTILEEVMYYEQADEALCLATLQQMLPLCLDRIPPAERIITSLHQNRMSNERLALLQNNGFVLQKEGNESACNIS
jgi:hypothetical protein